MSKFKILSLFPVLIFYVSAAFAQGNVSVFVENSMDTSAIPDVIIEDAKGAFLGKTNSQGMANISIADYPVLLRKEGYISRFVYSAKDLDSASLQPIAKKIPEVVINGKLNVGEYLLFLRDKNRPLFQQRDTTIYYHFSYSLSFPDNDWWEKAEGCLVFYYRGLGNRPSGEPPKFALIIQYDYKNKDETFVANKIFKKVRLYPPDFMLFGDIMSGGYYGWEDFVHPRSTKEKRIIDLRRGKEQIFTIFGGKKDLRILSTISFDSSGNLLSVEANNPLMPAKIGPFRLFDNLWGKNGINSYRTTYKYSSGDNNRLLSSMTHTSTFYKKGGTFYKMKFSANLLPSVPEQKCKIPLLYLNYNIYHQYENGFGIKELIKNGYDIEKDEYWKAMGQ